MDISLAFALIILGFVTCGEAKPGKPEIVWGNRTYALVEVAKEGVAYNQIVKRKEHVNATIEWNIWSPNIGKYTEVIMNGKLFDTLKPQIRRIVIQFAKGGIFNTTIAACEDINNVKECSMSDPVTLIVADTDGSHMSPLELHVKENNKKYYEQTSGKVVAGYFAEWSVYGRKFFIDNVPVPNLTHLMYAFIAMCGGDGINDGLKTVPGSFENLQKSCAGREDFQVTIHDPWAALQKGLDGQTWGDEYKGNFGQLMAAKKRQKDLKIFASIGGWTLSDPFFHFHDVTKRTTFVESVQEFLLTWKFFDGIDLDWEYPGGKGVNPDLGNEEDGEVYLILMKELRAMLDRVELKNKKKYSLTSAISAGWDKIQVVDYKQVEKYVEHLFVMTYDFKGAWSLMDLGHHSALYAPSWKENENYTTDFGVKTLLNQGVSPEKMVLGVAMYGRGWAGVRGLQDVTIPFTGVASGPITGTWENGSVDYRKINELKNDISWTDKYDDVAKAPFMFEEHTGDLLSYEDSRSVKAKADYVLEKGLGGLFGWELDADNGDILNAMNEGIGNKENLRP